MDVIFTLNEINQIAQQVWQQYHQKKIWAFYGEMGAGKTTFIGALCKFLSVADAVSSPTFSIINEYKSLNAQTIFHMDFYRIQNEKEAFFAGAEDYLLSGNFCFIEWPEKVPQLLPDDILKIFIKIIDENTRRLYIK